MPMVDFSFDIPPPSFSSSLPFFVCIFTLIVCTKLTGIRLMLILENTWPTIMNDDNGTMVCMMVLVGFLMPDDLKTLSITAHQQETMRNCTKVKVTGYLNVFIICLAVLLDSDEQIYHMKQHSKNLELSDKDTWCGNALAVWCLLVSRGILSYVSSLLPAMKWRVWFFVDVILLKNFLWGGSFICVGNMDGILERWREGKKERKKSTSLTSRLLSSLFSNISQNENINTEIAFCILKAHLIW